MNTEIDMQKRFIYILKGLAIVCVVCAHSTAIPSEAGGDVVLMSQILDYLGTMGVPVFFLISGYLFDKNTRSFGSFWKRKLKTIVVPWLFCETLLWFYVVLRKGGISFKAWILFLLGYEHTTYYLTVLMVFFLVFWFLKKDFWIYLVCVVSVFSIISTGWETGIVCMNSWTGTYYLNPLNWALFFGVGMLFNRSPSFCGRVIAFSRKLYLWLPCSVIYFLLLSWMNEDIYYFGRWAVVQHIINLLMMIGTASFLTGRLMSCPIEALGKYSFSVYLLHQFVSGAIAAVTNKIPIAVLVLLRPAFVILIVMLALWAVGEIMKLGNGKLRFIGALVGIKE